MNREPQSVGERLEAQRLRNKIVLAKSELISERILQKGPRSDRAVAEIMQRLRESGVIR